MVDSGIYHDAREDRRMPSIGTRIAALRAARGLDQTELARRIGISQPSMSNIESGKTQRLRGDTLAGLCRELHVHPDVILKGTAARTTESTLMESEVLGLWRALTPQDQEHLLAVARALAARRAAPKPASPPAKPAPPKKREHGTSAPDFFTTSPGDLGD